MAPVMAPPKARPGHPGDVLFGLLISFVPWFRNGPIGPKGPYPDQIKKPKSLPLLALRFCVYEVSCLLIAQDRAGTIGVASDRCSFRPHIFTDCSPLHYSLHDNYLATWVCRGAHYILTWTCNRPAAGGMSSPQSFTYNAVCSLSSARFIGYGESATFT